MKNLLILWSLPSEKEDYDKYESIIELGKWYFDNIASPINTKEFNWTDEERFSRAVEKVEWADLIIWELSNPSTGQWIEIWIAYKLNKSVIIVAEEWSNISWLIKWCSNIKDILYYADLNDLKNKLKDKFI